MVISWFSKNTISVVNNKRRLPVSFSGLYICMHGLNNECTSRHAHMHLQYHTHTKKTYIYTNASIRLDSKPKVPQMCRQSILFSMSKNKILCMHTHVFAHTNTKECVVISILICQNQIFKEILCNQCLSSLIFC